MYDDVRLDHRRAMQGEQPRAPRRKLFWTRPMLDVDDLWFKPAGAQS
jgi:hypothetical protein